MTTRLRLITSADPRRIMEHPSDDEKSEIDPASGGRRHDSIRYQSQLSIVIICHDKNIDIDIH